MHRKRTVAKNPYLNMRTPSGTLPHESLLFDNPKSFRPQKQRYFAAGHRTRSRSPHVSALALRTDESPASVKKRGVTPDFRWRLREFNDLRRQPVVFEKSSRFFARPSFHTRKTGKFARAMNRDCQLRTRQEFLATLRQLADFMISRSDVIVSNTDDRPCIRPCFRRARRAVVV